MILTNKQHKSTSRKYRQHAQNDFDRDFSQVRCYECNKLGHIAKFCRSNNSTSYRKNFNPSVRGRGRECGYDGNRQTFQQNPFQNKGNFRERSQIGTDHFDQDQSAQRAEADFDMDLNEFHRWNDESKRDAYFYDDVEEINNIRSDSSEDDADEEPL